MSEVNYIYDAANAFRAPNSAALMASQTIGELPLDKLVGVRPSSQRNKLGAQSYKVVLKIEEVDFVTEYSVGPPEVFPEEYTLTLEVGPAGATDTVVWSFDPTVPDTYVIMLDAQTIENLSTSRAAIALKLTAEGEAPSIKLAAWVL